MSVDLKDIKAIIDLMKKNSITEFELERADSKIKLKRGGGGVSLGDDAPMGYVHAPTQGSAPAGSGGNQGSSNGGAVGDIEIKSPMIGTFYRSPSPDSAPYADIGSEVGLESVVCIIEAMKVMNEIKAEVRGVITQMLVENGKSVEFGTPLFRVRPL